MAAREGTGGAPRVQSWLAGLSPWPRRGLTVAAGAFATLGHAPFQIVPAYIAAIVVLVWLLDLSSTRAKRLWSSVLTGLFFALGHFTTGLYWIASAFLVDPRTWGMAPGVLAVLGMALIILAPFWMAGCFLAMLMWTRDWRRIAALALALGVTEWVRGHIFTGFPWLLPGYIWSAGEPVSQLASLFGIYGLSAVTLLIAAAPATAIDGGVNAARRFGPAVGAALVLGLAWGWGAQRLATAPHDMPGALPVVRVTDSGLSQAEKWQDRPDQEWRVLARYLDASGAADTSHADILIWPEGAIPVVNFFTLENSDFLDAIGRGLGDRALIIGVERREPRGERMAYFNSAEIIDGVSGRPRLSEQHYDKNHLVPFGEYMPGWLKVIADPFHIASLQTMDIPFTPGSPPTRLVVPDAPPAVILICYESIFPDFVPRGEDRPGWLVNISNDAWFGDVDRQYTIAGVQVSLSSTGPWQAYEMARYRTIEEGLPMARAASGGVSAIIDAFGRAVQETHRKAGHAEAQLPPTIPQTPYANWGAFILLALSALIAALRFAPIAQVSRARAA